MMELSNKDKAIAVLRCFETRDIADMKRYINPNKYIQHNLSAPDGFHPDVFEGMFEAMGGEGRAHVVRAFQDGDFVFTHTDYNFFGPKIGFDIFRFENGLVVEHWDNLQETPSSANPSGHSMVDGTIEASDLDRTEENKELIRRFFADIIEGGRGERILDYISETVVQHAHLLPDTLSASLEVAGASDYYRNVVDHKLKTILGEGSFVLAGVECRLFGKPAVYYDLFRIENGLIVERWDVMEETLPRDQWQNTNGKF